MSNVRSPEPASVFVEWGASPRLNKHDLKNWLQCGNMCCDLYHVHLKECFYSETASRRLCQFSAPDAESVRSALRAANVKAASIWAGRVYECRRSLNENVIIELNPNTHQQEFTPEWLEKLANEWGQQFGIAIARTIVSLDSKRAIFLCYASSRQVIDEAVARLSQTSATAWQCQRLTQDVFESGEDDPGVERSG